MIPDLAIHWCLILIPDEATLFNYLYSITSTLYFIGFLTIYAGLAGPTYYYMYRYTRERMAFLLFLCMLIALVAISFSLVYYTAVALGISTPPWWPILRDVDTIISDVVIILYILTLMVYVDYIYRLPFDVHRLIVFYRLSGLPVYNARFVVQKPIAVEESLLAGFFTALNNVFQAPVDETRIHIPETKRILESHVNNALIAVFVAVEFFEELR